MRPSTLHEAPGDGQCRSRDDRAKDRGLPLAPALPARKGGKDEEGLDEPPRPAELRFAAAAWALAHGDLKDPMPSLCPEHGQEAELVVSQAQPLHQLSVDQAHRGVDVLERQSEAPSRQGVESARRPDLERALGAPESRPDDSPGATLPLDREEAIDGRGIVLQIAVHREHERVSRESETCQQGLLLAAVTAEVDGEHSLGIGARNTARLAERSVPAAIVDEDDFIGPPVSRPCSSATSGATPG